MIAKLGGKPVSDKLIPLVKPMFSQIAINDVAEVIKSGYLREGPVTKKFENAFKECVGSNYAYALSSGTAALHCAYLSILDPGDEVIVPSFTFFATASTIIHSRGIPVFADIDEDSFILEIENVKEKISTKTRAIALVHLFGNSADMKAYSQLAEDHNLYLINDCAQAHGTQFKKKDLGSFDHLNCYSFYPTKTLSTGEGGMVTTNDPKLAKMGALLKSHGDAGRYDHVIVGLNYRTTDIASAIGLSQLDNLDWFLKKRRNAGKILKNGINRIDGVSPQKITPGTNHSYSYFSILLDFNHLKCTRNEFMAALKAENIDCAVHYPTSLHNQTALKQYYTKCPVSESVSKRILSIPMHPYLDNQELSLIIKGIEKIIDYYSV